MPTPVRYFLAALIGAVAVPAAAVAFDFGFLMLLVGVVSVGMALFGLPLYKNGAESMLVPEILVVVAGLVVLTSAIELTRLLAGSTGRRSVYKRGAVAGIVASFAVFPLWGTAAYAMLHSRFEPGFPPDLIAIVIVLHIGAGIVAWPVGVLRLELRSNAQRTAANFHGELVDEQP